MRIILLQDYLRSGGTERQSVLLAESFANKGMDCTLMSFRPGGPLASGLKRARHLSIQTVDTRLDWWAPGLSRRLKALEPDVVLCMGRMANCHGAQLCLRLPRIPLVGTMRTGKNLPAAYRYFLRRASAVVANSRDAKQTLCDKYGIPEERISVINNALVFAPGTDQDTQIAELRLKNKAAKESLILLNVGMFRPEKQQAELIRICTLLPRSLDWQLWLAGDGPCLADCVRLAGDLNLSDRVRFLGWQANPKHLYAAADLAVHASTTEALSNFLIEAQANGLSCIAYKAPGNAECVVEGHTGFLVSREDRQGFCNWIQQLSAEPTETRAIRSRRARAHAQDSFDQERQTERYLRLFETLIQKRAAG